MVKSGVDGVGLSAFRFGLFVLFPGGGGGEGGASIEVVIAGQITGEHDIPKTMSVLRH